MTSAPAGTRGSIGRRLALGGVVLLAAYFLFWPVDIDPVAWEPPPVSTGDHFGAITSVEEVDGALYLGTLHDARIGRLRLAPT